MEESQDIGLLALLELLDVLEGTHFDCLKIASQLNVTASKNIKSFGRNKPVEVENLYRRSGWCLRGRPSFL